MKEYLKPEVELVEFAVNPIASVGIISSEEDDGGL